MSGAAKHVIGATKLVLVVNVITRDIHVTKLRNRAVSTAQ